MLFKELILFRSLGGGTGGGCGSLLLERLCEEFPKKYYFDWPVWPSDASSSTYETPTVEWYNSVLGMEVLRGDRDSVTGIFDNHALHNICTSKLNITEPTYTHMNRYP